MVDPKSSWKTKTCFSFENPIFWENLINFVMALYGEGVEETENVDNDIRWRRVECLFVGDAIAF